MTPAGLVTQPTIALYHGGSRWKGPPELRPAKKGRAEHGAGIYLTTSFDTARKYAAGNKVVTVVHLSLPIVLSSESFVAYPAVERLATELKPSSRKKLLEGVARVRARFPGSMPADSLLAILVNSDLSSGESGVTAARFMACNGIDASIVRFASEDWLVLFNTSRIARWEVVRGPVAGAARVSR